MENSLADRSIDLPARVTSMPRQVESQVSGDEDGRPRHRSSPPRQRAQPGQQLLHGERLDEIVVGPRVEAGNTVVHGISSGEHQDGGRTTPRAELRAHGDAVEFGEHDVEYDGVVLESAAQPHGLRAGVGLINRVPRLLQSPAEVGRDLAFVLHKQYAHATG